MDPLPSRLVSACVEHAKALLLLDDEAPGAHQRRERIMQAAESAIAHELTAAGLLRRQEPPNPPRFSCKSVGVI
jgi:hypothetical protein